MTVIGVEAKKLGFIWHPGGRLWCRPCGDYYVPLGYAINQQLRAMRHHRALCPIMAWQDLCTST